MHVARWTLEIDGLDDRPHSCSTEASQPRMYRMSKSAQACLGITWQLKAISLSFVNSDHGGLLSAMAVDIVIYGGQCTRSYCGFSLCDADVSMPRTAEALMRPHSFVDLALVQVQMPGHCPNGCSQ